MKPYQTFKLTEGPDVADIKAEGRATHVGRVDNSERGYIRRANVKRATRRHLKRSDRMRAERELHLDVEA